MKKLSPREKLMGIHALVWALVIPLTVWLPDVIGLGNTLVIIGCMFFFLTCINIGYGWRRNPAEDVSSKSSPRVLLTVLLIWISAVNLRAGEKELPPPDPRPNFTVCEIIMGLAIIGLSFAAICVVKRAASHIPTPPPPPPPSDRDWDGFPDISDRCPDEAGTAQGCPDYDGDGVNDYEDDCPLEFGKPPTGCPTNPTNPPPRMRLTNCPPLVINMGTMMVDTISLTSTGWTDDGGNPYLEQMDFGFDTSTNLIHWQEAATVTMWLSQSNRLTVWRVNGVPISTNYAPRVAGLNVIGALPALPGTQRFFRANSE